MNMRAAVFLLVLALAPFLVSSDDIVFFNDNGHYYQLVQLDKAITNDEARSIAAAKSHNKQTGYVVTIGTLAEQNFLSQYLNQIGVVPVGASDYPTIWAGASRSGNLWIWNAAGRNSNPFYEVAAGKGCAAGAYCNWANNSTAAFPSNATCTQIFLNNNGGPTPGTWRPVPCASQSQALVVEYDSSTTCSSGYTYRTSKGWCEDINECTNNAKLCGAGYQCVNTIGSYRCDDIDECLNATICPVGYQCLNTNGSWACPDINECEQTPKVCMDGYDCTNSNGGYSCSDINECSLNSSLCVKGYVCQNLPGNYTCKDFDECTQYPCSFGTRCVNTIGSYTCDSIYFIFQSEYNTALVLDYKTVNGINRLITNTKNTTANSTRQMWSYTPEGFIVNTENGQVVDAEGGLVYSGIKAILWPRKQISQANNQLWEYNRTSHYWMSANYPVALDIFRGQTTAGGEICLFTPKPDSDTPQATANQRWTLIETAYRP